MNDIPTPEDLASMRAQVEAARLHADNQRLRAALEPFAEIYRFHRDNQLTMINKTERFLVATSDLRVAYEELHGGVLEPRP